LETLSIYRNPIRHFPGELANMEMLQVVNATPLGLDADLKNAFNAGYDTFIAYMKAWSTVQGTKKLQLNWNANAAWDPLLELPVQCWRFAGTITHIYLNDNTIRTLPQNLAIMSVLQELHLERNGLVCLPYSMCQMTQLRVLNLTDNSDMYDPPYEIVLDKRLPGIMKYLRAMHMAPMLKSLVLNDFDMFYLRPNDLKQTTVEELSIMRKKAEFARSDGQPRNPGEVRRINRRLALFDIEALSLDSNVYDSLPEEIFVLTRLKMLSVAHNRLELVSRSMGKLSCLTVLHLDNNQLESVPEELESNVHLKKLTLNSNKLIFFPDVILRLGSLEVLNLASNQITELPPEMPTCNSNLKMLALQHNSIHKLPHDWGRMQKLVLFDITKNNLVYLPPSVSQCRRLKALYLSDNPLPAFPKDLLRIRGLQQVRMANTLMTGLPPELAVLTNLKELAIEGNKLVWPPQEVLADGLEKIMEYVSDHHELLKLDMETVEDMLEDEKLRDLEEQEQEEGAEDADEEESEEDFDPFEGVDVGGEITVDSILEHHSRIQDCVADMEELQQELEQLEKEHVKHTRIGNKGKIAELDRRINFINKQRRTIAGRIVEINNLRMMEEDLLVVDMELERMDNPPIEEEEEVQEEEEEEEEEGHEQ